MGRISLSRARREFVRIDKHGGEEEREARIADEGAGADCRKKKKKKLPRQRCNKRGATAKAPREDIQRADGTPTERPVKPRTIAGGVSLASHLTPWYAVWMADATWPSAAAAADDTAAAVEDGSSTDVDSRKRRVDCTRRPRVHGSSAGGSDAGSGSAMVGGGGEGRGTGAEEGGRRWEDG